MQTIAEEVQKKQQDCEEDLVKAEPALIAAQVKFRNVVALPRPVILKRLFIILGSFEHFKQSQSYGIEVLRISTRSCDQRNSGSNGLTGAKWQNTQRQELESGQSSSTD